MNFDSYDNRNNLKLESEVPSICKEEDVVMGIDEAGRGPVLGVYRMQNEKNLIVKNV